MRIDIKIQNLMLDTENYRIGHQEGQPQVIKALIEEQGGKLKVLAEDIIAEGLNQLAPFVAIPSNGNSHQYIVVEGNRRATAIKCVLQPELAKGTQLETAFKKLHKNHKNKVPLEIEDVIIFSNKQDALPWIRRIHDRGLKGAGREDWSSTARDRVAADLGLPTPAKDVREFVIANAKLDDDLRKKIQSEKFAVSTLTRLLDTAHIKESLGLELG